MLFNLLSSSSSVATTGGCFSKENLPTTLIMLGLIAVMIVFMAMSRRSQAKRQQEQMDKLNAVKPGNKVKTIGGICGVVVEVCPEDNTFVLETGSETSGKSYLKFDKQAIYDTDAVAEKPALTTETAENDFEETIEDTVDDTVDEVVDETKDAE